MVLAEISFVILSAMLSARNLFPLRAQRPNPPAKITVVDSPGRNNFLLDALIYHIFFFIQSSICLADCQSFFAPANAPLAVSQPAVKTTNANKIKNARLFLITLVSFLPFALIFLLPALYLKYADLE